MSKSASTSFESCRKKRKNRKFANKYCGHFARQVHKTRGERKLHELIALKILRRAVCDDQYEGSKPEREHAYELTNERESWGSVLPSAFQYLSSLLSLHSPAHASDMEGVNQTGAR